MRRNARTRALAARLDDMSSRNDRIVYRTGVGRIAPDPPRNSGPRGDGVVRVRRETGNRGGKTVTTIHGVPVVEMSLKELAGKAGLL